jgi:hypothetical protein
MNKILGLMTALALLGAASVCAQTIDLRTIKCSEFAALPVETQELVAVWLDGFLADDQAPDGLLVDFSETDADFIQEQCQKTPNAGLLASVEAMPDEQ